MADTSSSTESAGQRTPPLLRTPLAERHEALGARMVPFSGWLMPIQYEGIVAEHQQTRTSAGLFDLSHMGRLRITGVDAVTLIQRATTNDVTRLAPGAIQYALICNDEGKVREDLLVYRFDDRWRLVVNASNRIKVLDVLHQVHDELGLDAEIYDETFELALIGLQGPESAAILQPLVAGDLAALRYYHAATYDLELATAGAAGKPSPTGGASRGESLPTIISRTGYTGEDGFELMIGAAQAAAVWDALLTDARVQTVGLGARDTLRLEAGMALYGHELTEEITPYEARLARVVRLDKGPFLGRAALEQLRQAPPARQLVGLSFEPGVVPRAEFAVLHNGEQVGTIASGTFSPTLRRPIATAYVPPSLAAPGTELQVAIRNAVAPARVVPLPFVPHRTQPAAPRP